MPTATDRAPDRVTRRFLVSGKVQGVYFRQSTRLEAQRLGVTGVARNLPDGTVEVVAQGPEAAVIALKAWLGVGPPMAKVAAVQELEASTGEVAANEMGARFSVE